MTWFIPTTHGGVETGSEKFSSVLCMCTMTYTYTYTHDIKWTIHTCYFLCTPFSSLVTCCTYSNWFFKLDSVVFHCMSTFIRNGNIFFHLPFGSFILCLLFEKCLIRLLAVSLPCNTSMLEAEVVGWLASSKPACDAEERLRLSQTKTCT